MFYSKHRCSAPGWACLFLTLATWITAASASAESLVIFGDSLSDTGNRHAVSGTLSVPPYDMLNELGIPSDPYAKGGIHYTNGRTWIEHVAADLHAGGNARPALSNEGSAANYAWGGARAFGDNANQHLTDQINTYLADVNYDIDPGALHVIFIGGNDVVAALEALGDPASPDFAAAIGRIGLASGTVYQNVQTLISMGARRFLILNAPNVGLVPALDGAAAQLATCFALLYNTGSCPGFPALPVSLDAVVAGLEADPQIEVTAVDVFSFISGVAMQPAMFGLTNVNEKCVMPDVAPYVCKSPRDYLFWDGIHPTRAVHRILASVVLTSLDR